MNGQDVFFTAEVDFRQPYRDPAYGLVEIGVRMKIAASSPDIRDAADGAGMAGPTVQMALMQELQQLSAQGCPVKDLPGQHARLTGAAAALLAGRGITLRDAGPLTVSPTEQGQEQIRRMERQKAAAAMTPEELSRRMAESQREAEAMMAAMTPEERQEAMERGQRLMEKMMAEQQADRERIRRRAEETAAPRPKFCPNCGQAVAGAKFCPNCGTKLTN